MLPEESYGAGNARSAPMSLAELRTLLRYNPETGGFTWLINSTRVRVGCIAGTVASNGYVVIKIRGRLYKAHRLAWFFATQVWPDPALEIDHINEIKGDNRLVNLRLVTRSENQKNIARKRTWKPKPKPTGPRKIGRGFERPAPMPVDDLRALLSYDIDTGIFAWARPCGGKDGNKFKTGTRTGCRNAHGYIVIGIAKKLYPAHRLAWFLETGEWPPEEIDHRNHVRDDNRWENLRLATSSQNKVNRRGARPNTSGFRGVTRHRGKWLAQIGIDGRHVNLGTFDTPEAAYAAYCAAATEAHGDFSRIV